MQPIGCVFYDEGYVAISPHGILLPKDVLLDASTRAPSYSYEHFTELTNAKIDEVLSQPLEERPVDKVRAEFKKKKLRLIERMLERGDTYECVKCNSSSSISVDHIIPIAKEGTNDLSNLQFLCKPCNSRKGTAS